MSLGIELEAHSVALEIKIDWIAPRGHPNGPTWLIRNRTQACNFLDDVLMGTGGDARRLGEDFYDLPLAEVETQDGKAKALIKIDHCNVTVFEGTQSNEQFLMIPEIVTSAFVPTAQSMDGGHVALVSDIYKLLQHSVQGAWKHRLSFPSAWVSRIPLHDFEDSNIIFVLAQNDALKSHHGTPWIINKKDFLDLKSISDRPLESAYRTGHFAYQAYLIPLPKTDMAYIYTQITCSIPMERFADGKVFSRLIYPGPASVNLGAAGHRGRENLAQALGVGDYFKNAFENTETEKQSWRLKQLENEALMLSNTRRDITHFLKNTELAGHLVLGAGASTDPTGLSPALDAFIGVLYILRYILITTLKFSGGGRSTPKNAYLLYPKTSVVEMLRREIFHGFDEHLCEHISTGLNLASFGDVLLKSPLREVVISFLCAGVSRCRLDKKIFFIMIEQKKGFSPTPGLEKGLDALAKSIRGFPRLLADTLFHMVVNAALRKDMVRGITRPDYIKALLREVINDPAYKDLMQQKEVWEVTREVLNHCPASEALFGGADHAIPLSATIGNCTHKHSGFNDPKFEYRFAANFITKKAMRIAVDYQLRLLAALTDFNQPAPVNFVDQLGLLPTVKDTFSDERLASLLLKFFNFSLLMFSEIKEYLNCNNPNDELRWVKERRILFAYMFIFSSEDILTEFFYHAYAKMNERMRLKSSTLVFARLMPYILDIKRKYVRHGGSIPTKKINFKDLQDLILVKSTESLKLISSVSL